MVGNRRMQGLGRVLGSVANSVAHNAPCDVYIAKTDVVQLGSAGTRPALLRARRRATRLPPLPS